MLCIHDSAVKIVHFLAYWCISFHFTTARLSDGVWLTLPSHSFMTTCEMQVKLQTIIHIIFRLNSVKVILVSFRNLLKVWDMSTCEFVRTLNGHKRGIACLQYRDQLVVSGSSDNTIRSVLAASNTLSDVTTIAVPSIRLKFNIHQFVKHCASYLEHLQPQVLLLVIGV